MSKILNIQIEEVKGRVPVTVMHIEGQVDADSHQTLQQKATEAFNGGARNFLLDLGKVDYMSSAGFRALHAIYSMLKAGAGGVKLLNPSDEVKRILKTIGFDSYFQSFTDQKQAVDTF